MAPPVDGVFATNRLLPCTSEQLFAAMSHPERLAAWWGPEGFRNTFEVFEFWPQGRWTFTMQGPDGQRYPNESVFLETAPQRVVVRHVSPPHFTLTLTWADAGRGQTRLDWHQAFDDARVAEGLALIVAPANEQNLDRLQAVLAAAP